MSVEELEVEEELECSQCGEALNDDTSIETLDDGIVCEDCASNDYNECYECGGTVHSHRTHTLLDGNELCDTCYHSGDYCDCSDCSGIIHVDESTSVYDNYYVCQNCMDSNYTYCDHCDMYVRDDDSGHDHSGGCQCEAAFQTFKIRNDGYGMLDNDSRTTVALPSGVVSSQGMQAIGQLLRDTCYSYDLDTRYGFYDVALHVVSGDMDSRWQTKDGNFTKRLSRFAYKNHNVKLSPAVVSEIGNIARAHSNGQDYAIELTRQLNMSAEDFGHGASCYWQSYYKSRCALKASGGLGIRTFGEYEDVTGRAWIIPLTVNDDGFTPTDNTESPDAFVVFNGYGILSGYAPARILAHMAGMTYRKVTLYGSPMYVNGDMGYLVAPEAIASDHTDSTINLSMSDC